MEGSSHRNKISIHPPREGWDGQRALDGLVDIISIHPPREGWDGIHPAVERCCGEFQSTHPVRGGTELLFVILLKDAISIHPPREGWDGRIHIGPCR